MSEIISNTAYKISPKETKPYSKSYIRELGQGKQKMRAQKPSSLYEKSRSLTHKVKRSLFLLLRSTAPANVICQNAKSVGMASKRSIAHMRI